MTKTKLDHALELAALGFWVFPISVGKKSPPAVKKWQDAATRDTKQIEAWFNFDDFNIGISTSKFGDDQALLVVDVDNKNGKRGDHELLRHELEGRDLPDTFGQTTPTGGRHLVFTVSAPVRQGVDVLGPGLDVRSSGGYIVAAGSTVAAGEYHALHGAVAAAPVWLVEACGAARQRAPDTSTADVHAPSANDRAIHYLENEAPLSIKGQGGDQIAYKVAARLKDLGVPQADALGLMLDHWNDRCPPGWSPEKLTIKIENAYRYGIEAPGVAAPELAFPPTIPNSSTIEPKTGTLHPFDELNTEYAFCIAGGGSHILWETQDEKGKPVLQHLDKGTFHTKHASRKMTVGKREQPITELWLESKTRRSYDGLVFQPGQESPARFYNMWRGYAVQPADKYTEHPAVEAWLEHTRDNVCHGNDQLFRWLVGYFAHLIQRPGEKPLVALVFRGGKGVGKNAVVERVGALLGGHFLVTSNRRYLVGNFNGHLENCLLFALDEAFWSGDKQAEGQLKDLITGAQHVIEHKGKEPYPVDNKTRVVIIGNENWLAPASHDERRFAVFDVGDGRKQARQYFEDMRTGMERGGYSQFLRFLLDYSLDGIDVNDAPQTTGLLDQKHATLEPIEEWWLNCLTEGRIVAGDFEHTFGAQVDCERFRSAFRRYARERGIRSRLPDERGFGRVLKKVCPVLTPSRKRDGGELVNTYKLPPLDDARAAWDKFIGHAVEWSGESAE